MKSRQLHGLPEGGTQSAGSSKAEEIRAQREIVWKTARSLRAKSLHFLGTLAAQDGRMVEDDEKQFAIVTKRLASLLARDVENQGGNAVVAQKLAALQRDPKTWIAENFNPARSPAQAASLPAHETRARIDWSKWAPKKD